MDRFARMIVDYGADILAHPHMQAEQHFLQHGETSVLAHSIKVTYAALLLAERLCPRCDRASLVRGALLHDYFLYDWHVPDPRHRLHGFRHAATALRNARADFPALNATEADIIYTHMFPLNLRPPHCAESALVTLADKLCTAGEVIEPLDRGWQDVPAQVLAEIRARKEKEEA